MGRKSLGCEIDPFASPAGRLSVFASRSGYKAGAMIAWTSGTRLGPYELLTALGAGGMGEVWKALDTRIDRTVAITRLKSEYGERFRSEACAIRRTEPSTDLPALRCRSRLSGNGVS